MIIISILQVTKRLLISGALKLIMIINRRNYRVLVLE